ncbi:MAG: translocation/assembly module TamB [Bacteroidales bacterium]|nr:translocation/assembly module TamB [Bacteroidales bacterium]
MYRKKGYIIARIAGLLAVLVMAAAVAVQTPYIQTRLSKVALNQLAAIMDGRVQYDELRVMTSGVLLIRNLTLVDGNPYTEDRYGRGWEPADTVFKARTITATFALSGLFKGEGLHLGRVTVEDGFFHLVTEPEKPGNNLSRIFNLPPQTGPAEPGPNVFDIKKLRVKNFRFRLNSFLERKVLPPDTGAPRIDFDDLDVVADVTGHNIRMAGGKMKAVCDHVSAREKSGYVLSDVSGSCDVGLGKALIEEIHIVDPWSDVRLRSFSMTYDWAVAFQHFIEEVRLDGELQPSRLALQTLTYFSGAFNGSETLLDIQRGEMGGFVNDFRVDRLELSEVHSKVSTRIDGTCVGLPDVGKMLLDVQVQDLKATTTDISTLISGFQPGGRTDISRFARNLPLTLQLHAKGPLDRLEAKGSLDTPEGSASFEGDIRNLLAKRPIEAAVDLSVQDLDLGRILDTDQLGPATLHTRAGVILAGRLPEATLDTLHIDHIHALGRDFRQIDAEGSLHDGRLAARLLSRDEAAPLSIDAVADLEPRGDEQRFLLDGTLSDIDLAALGLDSKDILSGVSSEVHADVLKRGDRFEGDATLKDLRLTNGRGNHAIGDLLLTAWTEQEEQLFRLEAPFLDADYSGTKSLPEFLSDLQDFSVRRDLSALFEQEREPAGESGRYYVDLLFHNTRDILGQFFPGAYVADSTFLTLSLLDDGSLDGTLTSDRLAFGRNFLKDVDIQFDNQGEGLFTSILSSELRAGTFAMHNPAITASADDNDLALGVHYDSFTGAGGNAEIYLDGQLYRDPDNVLVVKAHPLNSYLIAGDDAWVLGESNIVLHGPDLYFDRFNITNGEQQLVIDGGYSHSRSDTLSLRMDHFDLALVDQFLNRQIGIEGRMDGGAFITSGESGTNGMLMDFQIDTLRLGGADAGALRLSSNWNEEGKELGLFLADSLDGRDILYAAGSYFLEDKRLDLRADLDALPLGVVAPFLSGVFSEMGGGISGGITLKGPVSDLTPVSDDLHLDDVMMRLDITGVPYTVRGPLRIDGSGCYFDGLSVRDDSNGKGTLQGSIRYDHLQDFTLDGHLDFNDLKVVDAAESPARAFYGLLRASGSAGVSGPFSSLVVDANVSTSGDGNIHIPLSGSLSSSSSNLLTFTEPVRELDPYEEMLEDLTVENARSGDVRVRGRLGIHPGVKAFVEIDKSNGNVASFNGQGNVSLNLRPSRAVFDLNGDYNINEGEYQFVVPGLLSKGFSIQQGSSVKFGGDIRNTALDISATYNVRTSLDPLLGTSSSSRRNVECGLSVTERLSAPQLDLSIDIPDLDPTTRSQVETALNTTDKIQKQFVSLLLLGSFLPNESSGVFNQNNLLVSNVVEMMSGQVNNILQRLDIPLDVGFGYQEGQTGQNLFDVAVSTQLFENRVIVGGSFGNRLYSTGGSQGDFAGDLDIQVKLDPEGKFRFNIFSHSADEFTSYLDFSQRNGVGVSYQKGYNSFGEFLRSLFKPKRRRQQEGEVAVPVDKEQVIIEIEKNENESGQALPDPDAPGR